MGEDGNYSTKPMRTWGRDVPAINHAGVLAQFPTVYFLSVDR